MDSARKKIIKQISKILFALLDELSGKLSEKDILKKVERVESMFRLEQPNFCLSEEEKKDLISQAENRYEIEYEGKDSTLVVPSVCSDWWTKIKESKAYYAPAYYEYLLNEEKYSKDAVNKIDERTDLIMNFLFDPCLDSNVNVTKRIGMVIGSVQAGKTGNYISLINKAADAGFKLIIVLAGTTSVLRKQTQYRIDKGFIGEVDPGRDLPKRAYTRKPIAEGVRHLTSDWASRKPIAMTEETLNGDFTKGVAQALFTVNMDNTTAPFLFVVKKNPNILEKFSDWLGEKKFTKYSMLLIDDEADNASINTYKNLNYKTRINQEIRTILAKFKKSAYVGFTATPFANIFIDPLFENDPYSKDLYPKDFIVSLRDPDSSYLGPMKIFKYRTPCESPYVVALAEKGCNEALIDWQRVFPPRQKKGETCVVLNKYGIPESLKKAIFYFLIVIALRNRRGQQNKHNSMLVHVSSFIDMHQVIKEKIEEYLNSLKSIFSLYAGASESSIEYRNFIKPYEDSYSNFLEKKDERFPDSSFYPVLGFKELLKQIVQFLPNVLVGISNSQSSEIQYSSRGQTNIIAVGGNSLARGFTLEGLTISYFLRNTKMCDTLLQMGRWFGYRKGYEDLCRIFTAPEYYVNFSDATYAAESLVESIRYMEGAGGTPTDFLIKVSQSPYTRLMLTARNKMYNAVTDKGVYLDGGLLEKGTYFPKGLKAICEYYRVFSDFVGMLAEKYGMPATTLQGSKGWLWKGIESSDIVELISKCPLSFNGSIESEVLEDYIKRNGQIKWRILIPSLVSEKEVSFSLYDGIDIKKGKRFNKFSTPEGRYSFSVTDQKQEIAGLVEDELTRFRGELDINSRHDVRLVRNEPLLIVNIFDLYDKEVSGVEPKNLGENVPFFSVSFAGDQDHPVFTNPIDGFAFNGQLVKHLQEEEEEERRQVIDSGDAEED